MKMQRLRPEEPMRLPAEGSLVTFAEGTRPTFGLARILKLEEQLNSLVFDI